MNTPLRFGGFAAEYDAARPPYPPIALHWLLDGQDGLVVDLGAGSGKLTESLLARCPSVVALEPDAGMVKLLKQRLPAAFAVRAAAEALPLPTRRVRTVLVAQAWHWFDHTRAVPEIARVLVPGGRLGLLWNAPAPKEDWQREMLALGPQLSPVTETWWPRGLPRTHTESRIFYWDHLLRPREIAAEHLTHLAVRKLGAAQQDRYLEEVEHIAATAAAKAGAERLRYRRMTWCARRVGAHVAAG